jgi:serine/threonine protein phosphatase PrpC
LALQFALTQHQQLSLRVGLFIIADGLGGHTGGEQASALAARLAAKHIINQLYLPILGDGQSPFDLAPINEVLETAVRIADQAIRHRLPEAGTTLTLALTLGDGVYIAHVGDSRAYLGERGRLIPLTRDHSMAARLVEMEHATPDETFSQRHILYRAIGQGAETEPDVLYHALKRHQYLLLCCDGLWSELTNKEMVRIIDASDTPGAACRSLVAHANENGGEDNVSVILAASGWPLPDREPSPGQADH